MEVAVLNQSGEETGKKVNLSEAIFNIEPNDHAIYLDVKRYLAGQRQGTAKSKERAEISGSTKKLKKQKGTGTARAGSIKSPVFRGGGRTFGPKPRDYTLRLNKKVKALARKSALTYKAQDNSIAILESVSFDKPRTKDFIAMLQAIEMTDKKTLLVLAEQDNNVYLSSRNISASKVVVADQLNTYDLLHADQLILLEGAVEKIEQILN